MSPLCTLDDELPDTDSNPVSPSSAVLGYVLYYRLQAWCAHIPHEYFQLGCRDGGHSGVGVADCVPSPEP